MRQARHIARLGQLVRERKGKRPFGVPTHTWEHNIVLYVAHVGCEHGLDWSNSA
jgi:hypothetical protein